MCVRVRESSPASECHPTPPADRLFWLDFDPFATPPGIGRYLAQGGRPESVESKCGAVTLGRACLFPPLSSGGALVAQP